MPSRLLTICNKRGLHARATAKFVKTVAQFDVAAHVVKLGKGEEDSVAVPASSILGLMMLGADMGSELCVTAEGIQAEALLNALEQLVQDKFGEGE